MRLQTQKKKIIEPKNSNQKRNDEEDSKMAATKKEHW